MANFTSEVLKHKRINQLYYKENTSIELTTAEDSEFYGYFTHIRDIADYEVRRYYQLLKEIEKLSDLLNKEIK